MVPNRMGFACSRCGRLIPHGEPCLPLSAPNKPQIVICKLCVYDFAERFCAEPPPPAEAAKAPAEKKLPPKKQKGKS